MPPVNPYQQNQYQQYQRSRILTASPAELTLMLYDGAIKFCNIAIMGCEKKDIETAHNNIVKVQKIVDEFRMTLDMKYPVAQDFERIYVYLARRLVEANMAKDPEILREVNQHLHSMRDNWKKVMDVNAGKAPAEEAVSEEEARARKEAAAKL